MLPMVLAVLSDLHVGRNARSRDLCPHRDVTSIIDDQYERNFLDFLAAKRIKADYLILPGDITERADLKEVQRASKVVKSVRRKLGVPEDRTIFVPGNHDVDWSVLTLGPDPVRKAQRYDQIKYDKCVFKGLMENGTTGHVLVAPYFSIRADADMLVVTFNSSWHDSSDEAIHYGKIDLAHISDLEAALAAVAPTVGSDAIRLFLVHHHPIQYSSPIHGEPDFSQMANADRLIALLAAYRFDLLIHGHTHQPRFQVHSADDTFPIGIVAAGSFSLDLPKEWHGTVNNQFHIISLETRDSATGFARGKVESWAYYCGCKWVPSTRDRDGIAHIEPFGVYMSDTALKAKIRPLIVASFGSVGWMSVSDMIIGDAELPCVRADKTMRVLRELSAEMGFIIHGKSIDDMVLLKR